MSYSISSIMIVGVLRNGLLKNNLLKNNLVRNISTRVPKKFEEIPYNEQYENRDFIVTINRDNIPENLTKPKYISSELNAGIPPSHGIHFLLDKSSLIIIYWWFLLLKT